MHQRILYSIIAKIQSVFVVQIWIILLLNTTSILLSMLTIVFQKLIYEHEVTIFNFQNDQWSSGHFTNWGLWCESSQSFQSIKTIETDLWSSKSSDCHERHPHGHHSSHQYCIAVYLTPKMFNCGQKNSEEKPTIYLTVISHVCGIQRYCQQLDSHLTLRQVVFAIKIAPILKKNLQR